MKHIRVTSSLGLVVLAIALAACSGSGSGTTEPAASSLSTVRSAQSIGSLGSYNVDKSKTTVAGISSGGFMAVQLQVAYSATFHFAAVYAGGPYYCAQNSLSNAQTVCQYATSSSLAASESYLDSQSSAGTIDAKSNLNGQKAYLWSGTSDSTVAQKTMNDLNAEYQHYGVATKYDNSYAAGHGWESPDGEVACGTTASPYTINCSGYDSENTWLTYFFGATNAKNTGAATGTLLNFDQTPYGGGANDLDTNGYLYVPNTCAGGAPCKLVVALDGCAQTQSSIGTKFITEAGLNKYADTNSFLVLYPYQVSSSTPNNPNGCWDWWGFEGSNYALKSGPQMTSIKKMVDRVQSGSVPTPTPAPTISPAPSATPTGAPTATPSPAVSPTPAPVCTTAANYYHVLAGRAHDSFGYALANGSNQNMGLDNVFYQTTLKQIGPNDYVIGCP